MSRPVAVASCVPRPEICTLEYAPVCGCDGVTYGNDCARRSAGISKRHDGECSASDTVTVGAGESCEGRTRGPRRICAAGLFCEHSGNTCGGDDRPGTCQARPEFCTEVYAPVCGCDGRTYGNDCHRMAAGVSLKHRGECGTGSAGGLYDSCGIVSGPACERGLVCDQRPGTCSDRDPVGTCVTAPGNTCARVWRPECGCDGKTYSNDCERQRARAAKFHDGVCREATLLQRGEWGGERISLSVRDPSSGGSLRFDCGSGVIYGPLTVEDGSFKWSGSYSRSKDTNMSAPQPVEEAWFTGRVSDKVMNLVMETTSGISASFVLRLGVMATFNPCL